MSPGQSDDTLSRCSQPTASTPCSVSRECTTSSSIGDSRLPVCGTSSCVTSRMRVLPPMDLRGPAAGRQRPTYLEVPLDLLSEPTSLRPERFAHVGGGPQPAPAVVE